jgi:hypothetical protein
MKKFLLTLKLVLLVALSVAQNRYITTSPDLALIPGSSLGDLILYQPCGTSWGWYIDQSNSTFKVNNFSIGINSVGYAEKAANTFSVSPAYLNFYSNGQMKSQGTGTGNYTGPIGNRIWLLGGNTIGTSKMQGMDIHGSSTNKVIITNVNGQFKFLKTAAATVSGYTFVLWGGATDFIMTGEYDPIAHTGDVNYQGHRSATGYMFSRGKYGIEFTAKDYTDEQPCLYLTFSANNIELAFIEINGAGAFSGISAKTDHTPALGTMYMTVRDSYIYNTNSEGIYFGNTSSSPPAGSQTEHRTVSLEYNNRLLRTGTESIQQDQSDKGSLVEHNVTFCSSMSYINPFQGSQLGGNQMVSRKGGIRVIKNIFHGVCLDHFINCDISGDDTPLASDVIEFDNVCYGTRSKLGFYFNRTNDGITPIYYSGFLGDLKNDLSRAATQQATNALFLVQEGVTPFIVNGLNVDVGISTAMAVGGLPATRNFSNVIRGNAVPEPVYVRSGFEGKSWADCARWTDVYGTGNVNAGAPVAWTTSDWVLYQDNWYVSKSAHTNQTPPPGNTTYWEQIFWDTNGWNSKHVNYNGTPTYAYPPDDFRLVADDKYNLLGYGLYDNIENTSVTSYKWEYAYDNTGTFARRLPLSNNKNHSSTAIKNKIGAGWYVRRTVNLVRSGGTARSKSDWIQIN